MERNDILNIFESLLFITERPITIKMFQGAFEPSLDKETVISVLHELTEKYKNQSGSLEIREIANGWQMATRPEFSTWIRTLFKDRLTYRLSPSAMETLSIIAYKQPITRNEIEEIRGVDVAGVLETLIDRKLIRIAGRKESMGRPLLYGTTQDFLRAFGLRRLEDLPSIESLVPAELPSKEESDAKATQNELPLETAESEITLDEIPVSVEPVENSPNQN